MRSNCGALKISPLPIVVKYLYIWIQTVRWRAHLPQPNYIFMYNNFIMWTCSGGLSFSLSLFSFVVVRTICMRVVTTIECMVDCDNCVAIVNVLFSRSASPFSLFWPLSALYFLLFSVRFGALCSAFQNYTIEFIKVFGLCLFVRFTAKI